MAARYPASLSPEGPTESPGCKADASPLIAYTLRNYPKRDSIHGTTGACAPHQAIRPDNDSRPLHMYCRHGAAGHRQLRHLGR